MYILWPDLVPSPPDIFLQPSHASRVTSSYYAIIIDTELRTDHRCTNYPSPMSNTGMLCVCGSVHARPRAYAYTFIVPRAYTHLYAHARVVIT